MTTSAPKPAWLKVRPPAGERYQFIKGRLRQLGLATVCEEARCPNVAECWGGGTATIMVMGDTCTRGCRFCAVKTNRVGRPIDPEEPIKVAGMLAQLELDYVVITSVDRDDLPDQGAGHFAAVIREVKARRPDMLVEVLIPDFRGERGLIRLVADAGPDVIAHNVETVARLTPRVRDPRANYQQSLDVLRVVKEHAPAIATKTSLMIGLGETEAEVAEALRDLRAVDCEIVTFGQYLQPTAKHLPVVEYVRPEVFAAYEDLGKRLGFRYVASGPLVRSSYRAGELFIKGMLEARKSPAVAHP
ncbi:MAG: lipoyl synthase [Candidatus Sericytochromatia bacterium]|nr:lipoyl synthase [Candidatus Sericytochromatia bacterium]